MEITVRSAEGPEVRELARVLGEAFADDPVIGWLIRDERVRARRAAHMFGALVRHQFIGLGAVDAAFDETGSMVGAAVWSPPGDRKPSTAAELRALPGLARAFRTRLLVAGQLAQRMQAEHPTEPHWYLAFVGTLPSVRGRGVAHALLGPRIEQCDATGVPAYLESSKRENIPYYERYGFDRTGELDVTAGGPPVWPMWRAPR
ncbi:GNAT family N-acetyltransferase [Nocardia blacklockiae]|uniref:GNAT family N-acetyltransferase n=1 Tax=Nocardia blacklockiae TaxID=480036 RepID=UPI0018934D89|nr:GNAT family N-acetyltransferase [Nocardia blacklockiae]MBF6174650.1 GNAT family N-acetyltransferase [Nocardia blacklockiae]